MSTNSIDCRAKRTPTKTRAPWVANTVGTAWVRTAPTRGHRFERQDLSIAEVISRTIADTPPQLYRGGA